MKVAATCQSSVATSSFDTFIIGRSRSFDLHLTMVFMARMYTSQSSLTEPQNRNRVSCRFQEYFSFCFIIVIDLIFMSSLWCINWVREPLRELNCLCITSAPRKKFFDSLLVLFFLWSPRLGKRELVFVLLVHLCVSFAHVCFAIFLFLLVLRVGCCLSLWHILDISINFFQYNTISLSSLMVQWPISKWSLYIWRKLVARVNFMKFVEQNGTWNYSILNIIYSVEYWSVFHEGVYDII